MQNFGIKSLLSLISKSLIIVMFIMIQVNAQSVDEIIAKNLKARGGIAKIKAIKSQRIVGDITFGANQSHPFLVEMKRPGKMKDEIVINGKRIIRTTNGKTGWVLNPLSGSDTARPMSADELKNTAGSADIDGPLVDYKAKGNIIEFAGKEKVNNSDTYKLIIKMKDGDVRSDYIDCKSFLEVKWIGNILSNGKAVKVETYFSKYKKVDGIMYAFLLETDTPGTTSKQKIEINKVDVNPKLDNQLFEKSGLYVVDDLQVK